MFRIIIALLVLSSCNYEFQTYPINLSWADKDLNTDGFGENYITPIKNQPCSDCYAYAAIGLMEARWQIDNKTSVSLDLSEQNLHNCMNISCNQSGDVWWVFNYIITYGLMLEENSPTGSWSSCENCAEMTTSGLGLIPVRNVPFYKVKSYNRIVVKEYENRRVALIKELQTGPVTVGIDSWLDFQESNGIFRCNKTRETGSGHALIIVGYKNDGDLFIAKNSWGENGLITISFDGAEPCGFASDIVSLPTNSIYVDWGKDYCPTREKK